MTGEDSDLRKRHHRSSEEATDDASKRRKHSHHRSSRRHHHHHRHRSSKRDHETNHELDDLSTLPPITNSRPEDDKEEGEILEEDSFLANGDSLKKKTDSDVESGEIESDNKSDRQNRGINTGKEGKEDNYYGEIGPNDNVLSLENGVLANSSIDVKIDNDYVLHECLDGKDTKNIDEDGDEEADALKGLNTEDLVTSGKDTEIGEIVVSSVGLESTKVSEKKRERHHGGTSRRDKTPQIVNGDLKSWERDTEAENVLKSPKRGSEKKKDNGNGETIVSRKHGRSRSPSHREVDESRRHRRRDDRGVKSDRYRDAEDHNLVRHTSSRRSESADIDRNILGNGNKSMSPDKFSTANISSHDRYHEAIHMRNRSRSRDHVNERRSRSRSILQDEKVYRTELDDKSYRNSSDQVKSLGSREKARSQFDFERVVRHDREERHGSRDWTRDRDRERSSSYNRHGGREDRHGSRDARDRGRERERERERERYMERGMEREREREREREGEREMEKGRDRDKHGDKYRIDYRDHRDRNREREENETGRDGYKQSRHSKRDEPEYHHDRTGYKVQDKQSSFRSDDLEVKLKRDEDEKKDYMESIELEPAPLEDEEIERIKEASRKRREAILAKYNQNRSQYQSETHSEDPEKDGQLIGKPLPKAAIISAPEGLGSENTHLDIYNAEPMFSLGKSPQQNEPTIFERTPGTGGLGDGTPKSERSEDMFCDDIFGESPAGDRRKGKGDGTQVERSGLNDNWDDAEGYYSYRFGEVLDGRYEIIAAHGKGVFSIVVRARDLKAGRGEPEEVAIKIIRSNDTMYKTGLDELVILKKLAGADPEDKRHCVRFLSSFKYRNHLCLVFESLHMNLREVLKKFGRNIGISLTAVRAYAKQLFIALKHLRNCGVLHCDIKPDNMLVNDAKNVLKLCDFGNAMFAGQNEITPYLVSRFYRAPEIILGLPYDHPLDIWSVGCCLYELYSGKVLFPGPSNNDMLRLHMELKGPFPKKMLRKGAFTDQHFDHDLNFCATEEDPVTKKMVKRLLLNIKPKDIGSIIHTSKGVDSKMLASFKDLLERIFVLDPEKRMTVSQALSHPFITGK